MRLGLKRARSGLVWTPALNIWFSFDVNGRHAYAQFGLDLVWI
jgi:hypothetical protein